MQKAAELSRGLSRANLVRGFCVSSSSSAGPLHIKTPLVYSDPLSQCLGAKVYLKLDCLQPVGSFKIRGIGATVAAFAEQGARKVVSSSGGNAGLASAYAARCLGLPCTVVVPETTQQRVIERLRGYGANVQVHGSAWDEANARATAIAEAENGCLVHPFDQPSTWAGHTSLIQELHEELPRAPDAIVTAVGGGGLLMGILQGLDKVGWLSQTRVVACETEGASSMSRSLAKGELVTLPKIDSIATSLGAKTASRAVFQRCQELGAERVQPCVVTDDEAIDACIQFSTDHRLLVEVACGAALASVYGRKDELRGMDLVVVEVCGGAGVDLNLLCSLLQKRTSK
mmetsp:Transcript_25140/g.55090  ORF Transcript_25140/g.55090 Transcript_25140/m.55090 type:complete len:343 (+) Transcript_25140:55-1083(+)